MEVHYNTIVMYLKLCGYIKIFMITIVHSLGIFLSKDSTVEEGGQIMIINIFIQRFHGPRKLEPGTRLLCLGLGLGFTHILAHVIV